MATKKRRTAAQRAATARMIAANKARKRKPARKAAAKREAPRRRVARNPAGGRHVVRSVHTTQRKAASAVNLFHLSSSAASPKADGGQVWKLPAALVKSKDFQAWAYGMGYVVSATLEQLRKRLARFLR